MVGGLTAREFGGRRRAQLLAALATATMPALWGSAHVANTTAYAVLALAALALVVARIGRTGDPVGGWPPVWPPASESPTTTSRASSPSRWSSAPCSAAAGG